jgi:NAD(P)-dependent dehydrogenase (short-subunit alcohol dehydrogenase family)
VEHLIKESEKKLGGPIDIVVNNAGIQHVRRALCVVCCVFKCLRTHHRICIVVAD